MKENINAAKSSPLGAEGLRIFLIGLMGSGKSFWCKKIAKKLKCGAYDLDNLVELNEEKSIAEMFEQDGEEFFRKSEAKVLRWFGEKKAFVLATGGGSPCFHDNMPWMNKHGLTIWLDEPIEVLAGRLAAEKAHRPLIKNLSDDALVGFLTAKRNERLVFYSQAKYQLTGTITDKSFAEIIHKHEQ